MTIDSADINRPEVVEDITAVFFDYEAALMRNDVQALNRYFWADPAVTRYGIADKQLGHEALAAYRQGVPAPSFTRSLHEVRITTVGDDFATAMCEFVRSDTPLRGFQTQTWVRMAGGWRIISAHVSMIAWPGQA